jgi:hypothetical protein
VDKTDHKDAVLIGRLIACLDAYLPQRPDADWARLRHLGQCRRELAAKVLAAGQRITDCWRARPRRCWAARPTRSGRRPGLRA